MTTVGWNIDELAASSANLLANGSYDVVVGNPPNITVRDAREHALYRDIYSATRSAFPLTMPFLERAFGLARSDCAHAGRVGLILANSFAKREFGRTMVEDYLPTIELTHVLDTSGAYIPGHITPTVILLGRARAPREPFIRMAVGIRESLQNPPMAPAASYGGPWWTRSISLAAPANGYRSRTSADRSSPGTHGCCPRQARTTSSTSSRRAPSSAC